jgi:hypothetical protein
VAIDPLYTVEPSSSRRVVSPLIAPVMRRRVSPPTSSRTAARYSAGVVPLSRSTLSGGPSSTQEPSSIPFIIPPTRSSWDPTLPSRAASSLEDPHPRNLPPQPTRTWCLDLLSPAGRRSFEIEAR